jgi:hypothetical protein
MKSLVVMLLMFIGGGLLIAHRSSYGLILGLLMIIFGFYLLSLFTKAAKEWWAER